MSKRALVSILILPAIVVAFGLVTHIDDVLNLIVGPDNDPSYFCGAPDPSPVADIGSSTVLQDCSAGTTVSLKGGETIAVDLFASDGWHELKVSDQSILGTVVAPTRRDTPGRYRVDEIALYRGLKPGQATITSVQVHCGGPFGCGRSHRWRVTVQVG